MNLSVLSSFCFKYALTGAGPMYSTGDTSAGTFGTGYLDLGASDQFSLSGGKVYEGVGEPVMVEALLSTTLNDAGTPRTITCVVSLQSDTVATFNSGSQFTVMTLGTFAAGATAGTALIGYLPVSVGFFRYLRMVFTFSGTLTGGAISGFLMHDAQLNVCYPSRITIG
jgi:hypothetical protein